MQGPLKTFGGKGAFGGKLARWIVSLMPPHIHFVEPFFGGGSVLLEKDPEGVSEVANDIDGELTHFWQVIRSPIWFADFLRLIQAMPFSEVEWEEAEWSPGNAERTGTQGLGQYLLRAVRFFVRCRQSRAGQFKDFATLSKTRTRRGMNEQASAWLSAIEGLPAVHARLKRVVILNRDALEVIREQDEVKTLFYLDPPYLHETRATKGVYRYEMTSKEHGDLLQHLTLIKGKFLLSGYRSERYDSVAEQYGWHRREFLIPNNASGAKAKRTMTECLWMNYRPEQE